MSDASVEPTADPADRPGPKPARPGWFGRLGEAIARLVAGPELARLQAELEASRHELRAEIRDAQASADARADEARVAETAERRELERRLQASLDEVRGYIDSGVEDLRRHADTRVDQTVAEVADLRSSYLGTRQEFDETRTALIGRLAVDFTDLSRGLRESISEVEALRDVRFPEVERSAGGLQRAVETVQGELAELRAARLSRDEVALEGLQAGFNAVQVEIEALRDHRVPQAEHAVETMQRAVEAVQRLAEELRDRRLPAAVARSDAMLERLHEELTVVAGLVDRVIAGEPIRIVAGTPAEERIPEALRAASVAFADAFRGSRTEISSRLGEYLPLLKESGPVIDLGCGRGEMLELLRDAGVSAHGIDADEAMVAACRRSGLEAESGDAITVLRSLPAASVGAVTAIHVLEHLPSASWMELVSLAARVLRPGGVLLLECPNPESLRVGGSLFWTDPTHRAPIHPDALAFAVRAVGLKVESILKLHPFPPEQTLQREDQAPAVRELAARLDDYLSGPRDFAIIARRPR